MSFLPDGALEHLREVMETPDFSDTRYRIEQEIGRGGMGVVYRAWDSQLDRRVALKVMDAAYTVNQEAKLLAQLEHPGLAAVYDAGSLTDGRVYYAMRLIEGCSLAEFLPREPSLPVRLRLFERICDAVAFAHSRGVLHCDLKPQNIMVGAFGQVFVVDWGVARVIAGQPVPAGGTPHYMAPEQACQPAAAWDARTDVFALGRILADLLPPAPARPLAAIARKAAAADPAARYTDVSSLAADVDRYLDGMPVSAYRDTPLQHLGRYWRRNQVLLLLIGTYFLVKVILFFAVPH